MSLVFIDRRATAVLPPPLWMPTPSNVRFRRARRLLDGVVQGIVDERRRSGAEANDLLGMLLAARDEDGAGMSDEQLRDEVMTLVLAGNETTATTLTWALHLLSENIAVVLTWAPLDGQVASHSPVRALVTLAVYAALPVAAALVVFHRRDLVG